MGCFTPGDDPHNAAQKALANIRWAAEGNYRETTFSLDADGSRAFLKLIGARYSRPALWESISRETWVLRGYYKPHGPWHDADPASPQRVECDNFAHRIIKTIRTQYVIPLNLELLQGNREGGALYNVPDEVWDKMVNEIVDAGKSFDDDDVDPVNAAEHALVWILALAWQRVKDVQEGKGVIVDG